MTRYLLYTVMTLQNYSHTNFGFHTMAICLIVAFIFYVLRSPAHDTAAA